MREIVDGKMIFTGSWKVLVLNFSVMGNTVFFSQKVDVKIIFTWYFGAWAFHDISGPGKYGFSCIDFSVDYDAITVDNILDVHKYLMKKTTMI